MDRQSVKWIRFNVLRLKVQSTLVPRHQISRRLLRRHCVLLSWWRRSTLQIVISVVHQCWCLNLVFNGRPFKCRCCRKRMIAFSLLTDQWSVITAGWKRKEGDDGSLNGLLGSSAGLHTDGSKIWSSNAQQSHFYSVGAAGGGNVGRWHLRARLAPANGATVWASSGVWCPTGLSVLCPGS